MDSGRDSRPVPIRGSNPLAIATRPSNAPVQQPSRPSPRRGPARSLRPFPPDSRAPVKEKSSSWLKRSGSFYDRGRPSKVAATRAKCTNRCFCRPALMPFYAEYVHRWKVQHFRGGPNGALKGARVLKSRESYDQRIDSFTSLRYPCIKDSGTPWKAWYDIWRTEEKNTEKW